MKVTIDRKTWLRGEGSTPSRLLRPEDGKMCCLGFVGLACGLSEEDISDKNDVWESERTMAAYPKTHVEDKIMGPLSRTTNNDVYYEAMAVNDQMIGQPNDCYPELQDEIRSESDRERRLTEILARLGIEAEFVG